MGVASKFNCLLGRSSTHELWRAWSWVEEESDKTGAKVGGGLGSQAVPQVISLIGAVDSRWICADKGNGAWLMVASLYRGGAKSQRQRQRQTKN